MPRYQCACSRIRHTGWVLVLAFPFAATGQTIWSGLSFDFSKTAFADPTLPANQDRITDNVWLTRGTQQGLINAKSETEYAALSPADTEWATDLNNPGKTIAAANWNNLSFTNWINAYGSTGSMQLPALLVGRNAVVHLKTDNIYLDLKFTAWSQSGGGSFSYQRAEGMPAPTTTGDYNFNGVVDAADYVVWRDSVGQSVTLPGSGADGDKSGAIDGPDYDFWRARFGNLVAAPAGQASAAAVPEPASARSLCAGLCTIMLLLKNWRKDRCDV